MLLHAYAWAARYTWLLVKLTPQGVVESLLFFSSYTQPHCGATHCTKLRHKTWRVGEEVLTNDEEGARAAAVDGTWC